VVDGFAERAGQVRRVRHAPITPGCGGAGTLAIFGPSPVGRYLEVTSVTMRGPGPDGWDGGSDA
jgi:hypothetical protein